MKSSRRSLSVRVNKYLNISDNLTFLNKAKLVHVVTRQVVQLPKNVMIFMIQ